MGTLNPSGREFISGFLAADLATVTATEVIPAKGASQVVVLTTIQVSNSHASVATVVQILDGTTVKWRMNCPAGQSVSISFPPDAGIPGSKGTAWKVKCETTGSAVQVNLAGYVLYVGS